MPTSRSAEPSKCLTSKKCQQLILAMAINAANAAKQYFNTFPFLSCAFWYLYLWQSMLQIFQFLGNQCCKCRKIFHFHSVGLTLLRASFYQHCNFFHKVQVQHQSPIISSIGDLLVCFLLPVLLKILDTKSNCRLPN